MDEGYKPGPWVARPDKTDDDDSWEVVYDGGGARTVLIAYGLGERAARLIAAAPDSHEANRVFVRAVYVAHNIPSDASDEFIYDTIGTAMADAFFAARAAVAKARGNSQHMPEERR